MKARNKSRLASLIIVLFLFPAGFSQTRRPPQRPAAAPFLQHVKFYEETPQLSKVVLKSGMTVLVHECRVHPVVSAQAFIPAGILSEPPQNPGLASLLSAMIRRGGENKTAGTLIQNVQALGGVWRHWTGSSNARFEIAAPAAQWKRALGIQAEALLNPSLDQEELLLESKLLLDQARAELDDPVELAETKLLELGFNGDQMEERSHVLKSGLRGVVREDMVRFHKAAYSPSRMTLVVSGDVTSGEVINEVVRLYDKPSAELKAGVPPPVSGPQDNFRHRTLRGDVAIPFLLFGFHAPKPGSDDYAAVEVLQAALGIGEGSVLSTRLRNQKKLILDQRTKLTDFRDSSFLQIQLQVEPKNIDPSEIALLTEIELLKRLDLDEAEVHRAVAQLELRHWARLGTASGRALAYANYELLGDWKKLNAYLSGLRKVKPSDVRRVASQYLKLENCSILEFMPRSSDERDLPVEAVERTLKDLLKPSADQEQAEREKETVPAFDIPESSGVFKPSEIQYPFQTASILRGPDMFVREDHMAPTIDMGLFFPGGRLFENKENAGVTALLTRLMAQGAAPGGASRFNRQIEIYGGRIRPIVAEDYFGFYFTILSQNVDAGLNLLLEAVKKPEFDKDAVDRLKKLHSSAMLRRSDCGGCSSQPLNAALFGDSPYSLDAIGTQASLSAIGVDSLQSWYNRCVKNRKALVVTVGDTKGTALASYFVKQLSGSRIQAVELPAEFSKPMSGRQTIDKNRPGGASRIIFGFQAPPAEDDDRFGMMVLQSYAGEQSNLEQLMRDQQGVGLRVQTRYQPRLRGGSFAICASANPDNENAAFSILAEQLSKIASGPIRDRDFRSAVNAAAGAFWIRSQERLFQIEDVALNILAGRGIDEYRGVPKTLRELKQEEFEEIARKVLKMDKAAILRIHGKPPSN